MYPVPDDSFDSDYGGAIEHNHHHYNQDQNKSQYTKQPDFSPQIINRYFFSQRFFYLKMKSVFTAAALAKTTVALVEQSQKRKLPSTELAK